MKNELHFPTRTRKDGSIYTDRSSFWKTLLCEALLALLAAAVFLAIALLVLIDPFNLGAPIR